MLKLVNSILIQTQNMGSVIYVFLGFWGFLLWRTWGMFNAGLVPAAVLLTVLVLVRALQPERAKAPSLAPVLLSFFFSLLLASHHGLMYAEDGAAQSFLRGLLRLFPLAIVLVGAWEWKLGRQSPRLLELLVAAAALPQILTLLASPAPHIDVFTIGTAGADLLLHGQNPYAASFPDTYGSAYAYEPAFVYGPGTLLGVTLARLVAGDIRILYLLANCLLALVLVRRRQGWLALAWLLFPVQLFVLEQAWVDGLLLPWFLLAFVLARSSRPSGAGIAAGVALAIKQFAIFGLWPLGLSLAMNAGRKQMIAFAVGAIFAFSALVLPFLAWEPAAFVRSTLENPLGMPMRMDAFSLAVWVKKVTGWAPPGAFAYGAGLLIPVLVLRAGPGRPALATAFGLICYFLLLKQAFCNYYFLGAGFLVLALSEKEA
jgi:hypothetical protein